MKLPAQTLRRDPTGEPLIDQGIRHGWQITYNPDDCRFYVGPDQSPRASFADWRNAVQWARTHTPE